MGLDVFPPPLRVSATLGTVCGADHAFAVALMLSCCMQRKRVLKVTVMRSLRVLTADFFIRAPAFHELVSRQEQGGSPRVSLHGRERF